MRSTNQHLIYVIPSILFLGLIITGCIAMFKPDLISELWFIFTSNGGMTF